MLAFWLLWCKIWKPVDSTILHQFTYNSTTKTRNLPLIVFSFFWLQPTYCICLLKRKHFWSKFLARKGNTLYDMIFVLLAEISKCYMSQLFSQKYRSWEVESYPRKSYEKLEKSKNWMNKTSFRFWDHLNSGLSKTCLKNMCKYEAIQTSDAALRVHMFSIFKTRANQ